MGAALLGAAVIGGGASIIGGNKAAKAQAQGAQAAADASTRATEAQIAEARRQYDLTRSDWAPYRDVGYGALGKLAEMYGVSTPGTPAATGTGYAGDGGFTSSPGYGFRRDEAVKAVERSAASRGALGSGGTKKALARYVDGIASSEYDTYANRLAALAGVGQSATGATAAAGQNATGIIAGAYGANGATLGNAAMTAGNARASSYANTASSINNTATNLASLYMYQQGGGFSPVAYPGGR
jgi:hypothetical protein